MKRYRRALTHLLMLCLAVMMSLYATLTTAQSLPDLTDFQLFQDNTDLIPAWDLPTTYADDSPLPQGALLYTVVGCRTTQDQPIVEVTSDAFWQAVNVANDSPGSVYQIPDSSVFLAAVPAPDTSVVFPKGAPAPGDYVGCRIAAVAHVKGSTSVVAASAWSAEAVAPPKLIIPVLPAPPSNFNVR